VNRFTRTSVALLLLAIPVAAGALWPRSAGVGLALETITTYPGNCTRVGHFRVTNQSSHAVVFSLALQFKQGQSWVPQPLGGGASVMLESGPKHICGGDSSRETGLLPHASLWRAVVRFRREPETWLHRLALRTRSTLGQHGWWWAARAIPLDHYMIQEFRDPVHENGCPTSGSSQ
jgi:hypothetical protein